MKWFYSIIFGLVGCLHAQTELSNELIVHYAGTEVAARLVLDGLLEEQTLSETQGIKLLRFATSADRYQAEVQLNAGGAICQSNVEVDFRREPNDDLYQQQPNLERLEIPRLWDQFQGGQTVSGREVVIAILDSGFDTQHEDLIENLWQNPAEIPNDGIDNDDNGFVDDISGWNFPAETPQQTSDTHGTSVTGILGARGDNQIGVSGINWRSKLMLLQINTVADIIAAYDYIIAQRSLYNDSNGEAGAFIVATNASFGLEGQSCNAYPAWGMQYDRMGEVGILTAASTANREWDVDEFGDMPTTCPSDFMIGVANSDDQGDLTQSSAWGAESVDLAAPGRGSFSTRPNNNYGGFGSTSAAAPYVTGTIALLYGHPCERFQRMVAEDPPAAALMVREAIINAVQPVPELRNLLASGGELAPWRAWQRMDILCGQGQADGIEIFDLGPNPVMANTFLSFDTPGPGPYFIRLFDTVGRMLYETRVTSPLPARVELPMSSLPVGVYRLGVYDGEEISWRNLLKM